MDMNETPDQLDEQPKTPEQQCEELLLQWGLATQHGEIELPPMPEVRAKRSLLQNWMGGGKSAKPAAPAIAPVPPSPVAPAPVVDAPVAPVAPVVKPAAPKTPVVDAPVASSAAAGAWFVQQPTWVKMAAGALVATILFTIILLSMGDTKPAGPDMSTGSKLPPAAESIESLKDTILALEGKIKVMTDATSFRAGELDERSKKIEELQGNLKIAQTALSLGIKTLAATQDELKALRTDSGEVKVTLAAMTREYEVSCKKQEALQVQIEKLKKANEIVAGAMGTKPEGSPVANLDDVVAAKVAQETKALNAQIKTLGDAKAALAAKNTTLAADIAAWTKKQAAWDAREKQLLASNAGANAEELKKTIATWQTKLTAAEMAQTAAEQQTTTLATQLATAKSDLAQTKSFKDELDAEIAAMAAEKKNADARETALQGKLAAQVDANRKTHAILVTLKKTATASGATNAELAALQKQLAAQTLALTAAKTEVTASRIAGDKLLSRMLLLYMGPPQPGISRLTMLQQAIKRNRLAARGQSLKAALALQPKAVVSKVDALLTQLSLLDASDVRAVTRFRETLAKSGVEAQMVELASAKTATPALVAYLTEAQLIFAATATA